MFIGLFTFKGVLLMKEHKKLYKAGKLWLAMTIFTFA
ncbi:MAG TPA: KxYKxGKxW signal peptide domain-containing protein, partial [Candidatus Limosilactobacillus merdigallinarum]|nr:KxYKxGKxW signal peptide domain-containing protein [Candidatus Limosilactobacillus merdigallinarum]